jgi:hypothetical protein
VTAAAFGWRYRSVESFGPEASVSPLAQSGSGVRVADLKGPLTRRLFEQILGASSDSSGTPPMELIKVEVGRHRARLHCAGRMESREKS